MIEKVVLDYLSEHLDVPCFMEKPNENINKFVVIEKTGSDDKDGIWGAIIVVQSYAPSLFKASVLNEEVKHWMKRIIALDEVSDCTLNSDYNFTDTSTKQYRYQSVFDITHY